MITKNKLLKFAFFVVSIACFIAIGVCFITDIVLNDQITWAVYPFICVPFFWLLVSTLLLAAKHRIPCFIIVFSIAVFPFLSLLEHATPVHGWYKPLGFPLAVLSAISLVVTYILLRFTKINKLYLSAFLVLYYGVVFSTIVRIFVARFLHQGFFTIDIAINTLACIGVAVLLAVIGYSKNKPAKPLEHTENPQEQTETPEA